MTTFLKLGFLSTTLSKSIQPWKIVEICSMTIHDRFQIVETSKDDFPAEGWSFTVDGEAFGESHSIETNQALEVVYSGDQIQSFTVRSFNYSSLMGILAFNSSLD